MNNESAPSHEPCISYLGAHARALQCEFALATDCGTVFEADALAKLVARLDADQRIAAVTGYQRVMPSEMQGTGYWELWANPIGNVLRQIQRYDCEVRTITIFRDTYRHCHFANLL
jgi:hypothetical protein